MNLASIAHIVLVEHACGMFNPCIMPPERARFARLSSKTLRPWLRSSMLFGVNGRDINANGMAQG